MTLVRGYFGPSVPSRAFQHSLHFAFWRWTHCGRMPRPAQDGQRDKRTRGGRRHREKKERRRERERMQRTSQLPWRPAAGKGAKGGTKGTATGSRDGARGDGDRGTDQVHAAAPPRAAERGGSHDEDEPNGKADGSDGEYSYYSDMDGDDEPAKDSAAPPREDAATATSPRPPQASGSAASTSRPAPRTPPVPPCAQEAAYRVAGGTCPAFTAPAPIQERRRRGSQRAARHSAARRRGVEGEGRSSRRDPRACQVRAWRSSATMCWRDAALWRTRCLFSFAASAALLRRWFPSGFGVLP